MDSVLGLSLRRFAVALLLAFVASHACAAVPAGTYYYPANEYTKRFGTPDAACRDKVTSTLVFDHSTGVPADASGGCFYTNTARLSDPAASQYGWTQDCCVAAPPPTCAIGSSVGPISWTVGYRTGASTNSPGVSIRTPQQIADQSFCSSKCTVIIDKGPSAPQVGVQLQAQPASGGYYPIVATANYITNGGDCVASQVSPDRVTPDSYTMPPVTPAEKDKCPPGTISGGIDSSGTPICLGTATASSAGKSETSTTNTTNGQGQPVKTTINNTTNADGSITTSRTDVTTNADGSTTTTTNGSTGATPSGAPGHSDFGKGDPTKPEDKSDLCKVHPELNVCKNSSVSGSCEATACEGDAIQCAQLRTANAQRCDEVKENDLSTTAKGLTGNNMTGLPTTATATVVDFGIAGGQLDQGGWLGGGSCFADKTVNVMGRSVTMKLSIVCPYLENLKYALMIAALLISYKIVGGTILKEV